MNLGKLRGYMTARARTDEQLTTLRAVNAMTHMGGSCPLDVVEWRRREALRRRRLLKYVRRKRARWDHTFYDITPAGAAAISD